MQTQNYVFYVYFLVLKESEQSCVRAFCKKIYSKSMVTSLITYKVYFDLGNEFCYSLMYHMQLLL